MRHKKDNSEPKIRMNIYLTESQRESLRKESEKLGISSGALIKLRMEGYSKS